MTSNPFFARSPLPYELPDFAKIGAEHYLPAFERGMAEQLAEIDAITSEVEVPTFDNVVVALERSGALLTRVSNVFGNIAGADSSAQSDAIEAEISPRLAAHRDAIHLDPKLFGLLDSLYGRRDELGLDEEQLRLLELYHLRFVRAGAGLDTVRQDRLRSINVELAASETEFGQANTAGRNAATLILDGSCSGLPSCFGRVVLPPPSVSPARKWPIATCACCSSGYKDRSLLRFIGTNSCAIPGPRGPSATSAVGGIRGAFRSSKTR
ncbi:hypothetical protein [Nocardia sp. NPDC003963]